MEINKNLIELRKQAEVKANNIIDQTMLFAFNMAEERLIQKAEAINKLLMSPMAQEIYFCSLGNKFIKLNEIRRSLLLKSQHYINAAQTILELNKDIMRNSNNI